MMSLAQIREHSRWAARKAAQERLRPYIVEADDLADLQLTVRAGGVPSFPFPFIGDHKPPGFKPTGNLYLVDSSGFGAARALVLTVPRFVRMLREGFAYAVVEHGPFQVHIREFQPPDETRTQGEGRHA